MFFCLRTDVEESLASILEDFPDLREDFLEKTLAAHLITQVLTTFSFYSFLGFRKLKNINWN